VSSGDPVDEGRRAFLRGTLFTTRVRKELERSRERLGPAPPWIGPLLDAGTCSDCDAPCVPSCGPGVLRRHDGRHELAGLPYLVFTEGGCTHCGDCVDACPVEADRDGPLPRLGLARLDDRTCLVSRGVTCIACLGPCEAEALSRDARGRISVLASACTGCGACVAPCPVDAISVRLPG
jgi:ferredoxin-type protein NapF